MYEKLKAQSFLLPSSSRVALKSTARVATTNGKLRSSIPKMKKVYYGGHLKTRLSISDQNAL